MMAQYLVTNLSKDESTVRRELTKTVPFLFRLRRGRFSIEETKLLYTPYLMDSYDVEVRTMRRKLHRNFYMCTDLTTSRIKAYDTVDSFTLQERDLPADAVLDSPDAPLSSFQDRAPRDLVLRVLPRQLHSYQETPMQFLESTIFYRPPWLIRYRLLGKTHIYKTYGDPFNL